MRKSTLLASNAFVEGWAHYCEHMMMEAGFRRGDVTLRLGQLAESLVRLARFVVGIRLHCEDLSVEQGMRFFRDEAFLEEATARREAERGTFDPGYIVYSLGKLMMLKLRHDYQEQVDGKFSLRTFHDAVLAQGTAPLWAHRRLLLNDTADAIIGVAMPLYEYECDACGGRFEVIQKFSEIDGAMPSVWQRPGAAPDVVAGDSVQRKRLLHHRLRAEGEVGCGIVRRRRLVIGKENRDREIRHVATKSDTPASTSTSLVIHELVERLEHRRFQIVDSVEVLAEWRRELRSF